MRPQKYKNILIIFNQFRGGAVKHFLFYPDTIMDIIRIFRNLGNCVRIKNERDKNLSEMNHALYIFLLNHFENVIFYVLMSIWLIGNPED